VRKTGTGEYVVQEEVKVGLVKYFTRKGSFLLPIYLFSSVFFSTMLSAYLALCAVTQLALSLYAVTFGALATPVFWVETVRQLKEKPF
jgi:hypothetical protein